MHHSDLIFYRLYPPVNSKSLQYLEHPKNSTISQMMEVKKAGRQVGMQAVIRITD